MDDATNTAGSATDGTTPEGGDAGNGGSESAEKPKKKLHRKPLWLLIPLSYAVVPVEGVADVERPRVPASYQLVKCTGKKEIEAALAKAQIDVTNSEHVLLLRADPMPLRLQQQVIIKWSADR